MRDRLSRPSRRGTYSRQVIGRNHSERSLVSPAAEANIRAWSASSTSRRLKLASQYYLGRVHGNQEEKKKKKKKKNNNSGAVS